MAKADLVINVLADVQNVIKGLKEVQDQTKELERQTLKYVKTNTILTVVSTAWKAVSSVISTSLSRVKELVESAKTQIDAERKLQAVLIATGNAAGFTADELKAYASQLQSVTNFGGDATLQAMAVLAMFKQVSGPIFKESVSLILDMSSVLGTDLKSAAIQVGKALNDPITGITALRRVGISFTEEQKRTIQGFMELGDIASAQRVILEELKNQFGGTAEAMVDPVIQAQNAWGDLKGTIGTTLLLVARVIAKQLLPAITSFNESISVSTEFQQTFIYVIAAVIFVIDMLRRAFQLVMTVIYGVVEIILKAIGAISRFLGLGQETTRFIEDLAQSYSQYRKGTFESAIGSELWSKKFLEGMDKVKSELNQTKGLAKGVGGELLQGLNENQDKINSILNSLREQLETIGMSDVEKKIHELQKLGATTEEIDEARKLLEQIESQKKAQEELNKAKEDAKRITESVLTPEEKNLREIQRAQELFQQGLLSADVYMKYLENMKATISPPEQEKEPTKRFAEAVTLGSGAFSNVLSAIESYRKSKDSPENQTAKNTGRLVQLIDQLLQKVSNEETIDL